MSDDVKYHAPELQAVAEKASAMVPPVMGICLDALSAEVTRSIDSQLDNLENPEMIEQLRAQLIAAGEEPDEAMVSYLSLRAVIGGTYTFGIAVGLALAAAHDGDDQ